MNQNMSSTRSASQAGAARTLISRRARKATPSSSALSCRFCIRFWRSLANSLKSSGKANRLQKRHDKADDDGVGLRALREIRVRAAPAWDAERVELMFWFIRAEEDVLFKNQAWHELLDEWLKLLPPSTRFSAVDGTVVSLDDITAKDYLQSDRLDLDRLSSH